ncbi:GSU2403 family nucleotidyltransferase fold protein [Polaromonas sp. YR568]|uniref:GSU2403 family nucleotidyltransferase fold protein n=1 Tax=Polaromonas sp. YR568 TaxID=1855301 RepID=UPI00398BECCC
MPYTDMDESTLEHIRDATTSYLQLRDAKAATAGRNFRLEWVETSGVSRLHKYGQSGELIKDLGPRNDVLSGIKEKFDLGAANQRELLDRSEQAVRIATGLNVARGMGRVPTIAVKILDVLWQRQLMAYYLVIGTYAMYAYEAAAGVVFDEPTMATNDVDLLYNVDKKMKFAELVKDKTTMLEVLQEADPTFERDEEQKESAKNRDSFAVDLLRQEAFERFGDAFSISGIDGDLYPVQAKRAKHLLSAPVFEQVVVGVDGSMTLMKTIDPKTFAGFKGWMANLPDREPLKKIRDKLQSEAIHALLVEGRLQSKI